MIKEKLKIKSEEEEMQKELLTAVPIVLPGDITLNGGCNMIL